MRFFEKGTACEIQQLLVTSSGEEVWTYFSVFMLTIWALWKGRNARLFERYERLFPELLERTREEAHLWIEASASRLSCLKREE